MVVNCTVSTVSLSNMWGTCYLSQRQTQNPLEDLLKHWPCPMHFRELKILYLGVISGRLLFFKDLDFQFLSLFWLEATRSLGYHLVFSLLWWPPAALGTDRGVESFYPGPTGRRSQQASILCISGLTSQCHCTNIWPTYDTLTSVWKA